MKTLLNCGAALLCVGTLFSCASDLTPAEIQAKAQEKFNAEKAELQAAADADCEKNMETYKQEAMQSMGQ
jgi:hypothetical protein